MRMTTPLNPKAREQGLAFVILSGITGILGFILFSGVFRPYFPLNAIAEFMLVVFSLVAMTGGVLDLTANHQNLSWDNALAWAFFILAGTVLVFNVIVFIVNPSLASKYHIAQSDFEYGAVLSIALVVLALFDLIVSHYD